MTPAARDADPAAAGLPTIIEAALSGFGPGRSPHVPVAPDAVAGDILACLDAGAAVVHNHIDDVRLAGGDAARRYGEGWAPVLRARPDAILYATVGAAPPDHPLGRYANMADCVGRHGARMGLFDPGSLNVSRGDPDGQPRADASIVYVNDYALLDRVLTAYAAHAIPCSIAVYDPTFLRATLAYERAGRFVPGSFLKLYFGGTHSFLDGRPGLSFGLPPTVAALDVCLSMMAGSRLPWAAAVLGGDLLAETDFARAVLARGGHLRVGLEDHAGADRPTNAALVARAASFARSCGRPPASPAQAAAILGLAPARPAPAA